MLLRSFGNFVESLNGKYITAEDVGMSVHDMEFIRMETNHVTGIKRAMGGSGDPSILTALGVFVGMKAALKKRVDITSIRDLKVGIQGFGKVGYHLCSNLQKEGAIIYGYDIDKSKLDTVVDEFGVISDVGQQMKEGLAQSKVGGKKDNKRLLTENERDEWYKRHMDKVKEILYDERFTKSNMQHLEESMDNVILDAYENVNKVDEKKIGGDNRLEWCGTTGKNVKRQKRKQGQF